MGFAENTPKDLGNLFTFKELSINGQAIPDGSIVNYSDNQVLQLTYDWELDLLKEAVAGDFSEILVPSVFTAPTNFPPQDIVITNDGVPLVVGKYSLDATTNILRFEFNEAIEGLDVENGIVGLGVKFKLESFSQNVVQRFAFNDLLQKTFELTLRPQAPPSKLTKGGALDANSDPKWIDWSMDILNPEDLNIQEITLIDPLPDGLQVSLDQLSIKTLALGLNGTKTVGDAIDSATVTKVDNTLTLSLPDLKPFTGYRITLRTPILDNLKTAFTNTATLNYTSGGQPVTANATHTLSGFTRSALLEKTGQVVPGTTNRVRWQLDLNKPQMTIPDATLEEILPIGHSLRPGTLALYSLSQINGQWQQGAQVPFPSEAFPPQSGDAFPLALGNIEPNQAYRIIYETDINYAMVNMGNYQKNNTFVNTAQLFSSGVKSREVSATVVITRPDLIKKSGTRADYATSVGWTITINEPSHPISQATVTDTISSHLSLDLASVKIYEGLTGSVEVPTAGKVSYDENTKQLSLALGDIVRPYRLVYSTQLLSFNQSSIPNTANLVGTGISGTASVTANATINANAYTKTESAINYATNRISWRTDINPRREPIQALTITDTFPQKGLVMLPETLVLTHNGTTLVKDQDYSLAPLDNDYKKGYVVTILPARLPLTRLLRLTYDTSYSLDLAEASTNSYPPQNVAQRQHKNSVSLAGISQSGLPINAEFSDLVELGQTAWLNGTKAGKLISYSESGTAVDNWVSGNTRAIEWQVYYNFRNENLGTGVILNESWDYPGTLKPGTLKLLEYTVASNGTRTLTGTAIDPASYTVTNSENAPNQLQIHFANDFNFNKRYALVFVTEVPKLSLNTYSNTATITVPGNAYRSNSYSASLTYAPFNNFLQKLVGTNGQNVYQDDELLWTIHLNESLSLIESPVIEDTISSGHLLLDNSLSVVKFSGAVPVPLTQGLDYTLTTETITSPDPAQGPQTRLTLAFTNPMLARYQITYKTVVIATNGTINNTVKFSGANAFERSVVTSQLSANQFSFIGGNTDPTKGNLTIRKIDEDSQELVTTGEAKFELYYMFNGAKRVIGGSGNTFSTSGGLVEIKNLSFRTYYLREVEAPPGYHLNGATREVVLSASDVGADYNPQTRTKTLAIPNLAFKGAIRFKKLGEYTAYDDIARGIQPPALDHQYPPVPQEGVVFDLYRLGALTPLATTTSDDTGQVVFSNIPYGSYVVKEKTPLNGYQLSNTSLVATITQDGETVNAKPTGINSEGLYSLVNEKIRGSLQIEKRDSQNPNIKLAGAVFGLYRVIADEEVFIGNLTTDAHGQATMTQLEAGNYIFREISAPAGYVLSSLPISATISQQGATVIKAVDNSLTPVGSIHLTKVDALSQVPLEGTRFELKSMAGQTLATGTTNDQGQLNFNGLLPGNYQVFEIEARSGYILNESPITTAVLAEEIKHLTLENQPQRKVKITKVDAANPALVLEGAIFQLLNSQGQVVASQTTGNDGLALITAPSLGSYKVREANAPAGYNRSTSLVDVVIDAESPQEISLTLSNQKIIIQPEVTPPVVTTTTAITLTDSPTPNPTPNTTTAATTLATTATASVSANPITTPSQIPFAAAQPVTTTVPSTTAAPTTVIVDTPIFTPLPIPEGGSATVQKPPQNGTVEILTNGNLEYRPNPGFTGRDEVTLTIEGPEGQDELTFIFEVDVPLGGLDLQSGLPSRAEGTLPQTGEASPYVFYLLGTLTMALGLVLKHRG